MLPGPSTTFSWIDRGVGLQTNGVTALHPDSKIYVQGNLGPGRMDDRLDEWDIVDGPESFRSQTQIMNLSECRIYPANDILEIILNNAGANVPQLDAVDQKVIDDVRNGTGNLLERSSQLKWPVLNIGNYPQDTDHDGMPDNWEISVGLDPDDAFDGNLDQDGDGYTNIEEYLNELMTFIVPFQPSRPTSLKIKSN